MVLALLNKKVYILFKYAIILQECYYQGHHLQVFVVVSQIHLGLNLILWRL
jgi:hypothetical protein